MPTEAKQLPYVKSQTEKVAPRTFRKQVLPVGRVEHPKHGDLEFTPQMLRAMVQTFDGKAYDMVPFLLANEKNEHHADPERIRGTVRRVEATDDGLYATVETSDRGAQLLEENPDLPVSVRMVTPKTGPFKGLPVLGHVLGTVDPVAKGMKPWELIEASAEVSVTDLSDGTLTVSTVSTDALTAEADKLSNEDIAKLREIQGRAAKLPKVDDTDKSDEDREAERLLADLDPDDLLARSTADTNGDETDDADDTADDTDQVAALSDKDREQVELANSRAESAQRDVEQMKAKLAKQEWEHERDNLVRAGVPPSMLDLAQPVLELHDTATIELSNQEKVDPQKVIRDLLNSAKGTVDLTEAGHADEMRGDEAADAKAAAEKWRKGDG